ncbi:hypothetical protein ABGB14_11795 [Nonomuraea sp. B10E15]|uniref:hypothetical protein n=1 Tax=Nonomuraea sp. B10E15 TaxID=3153560 RepID=UPI00325D5A81
MLDLIQAVRGIHDSLRDAAGGDEYRLQLLQLELPLLGGRLWSRTDAGRRDDHSWIRFVSARVQEYRERATTLRQAVEQCVTDEDSIRLARDIEDVKRQLLERKQCAFSGAQPYQRFLYREFVDAWKRAGR